MGKAPLVSLERITKIRKELFPHGHEDCWGCEEYVKEQQRDADHEYYTQSQPQLSEEGVRGILEKYRVGVLFDATGQWTGEPMLSQDEAILNLSQPDCPEERVEIDEDDNIVPIKALQPENTSRAEKWADEYSDKCFECGGEGYTKDYSALQEGITTIVCKACKGTGKQADDKREWLIKKIRQFHLHYMDKYAEKYADEILSELEE